MGYKSQIQIYFLLSKRRFDSVLVLYSLPEEVGKSRHRCADRSNKCRLDDRFPGLKSI